MGSAVPIITTSCERAEAAALIVNADDWGRDARTTQAILECVLRGAVSSASAMVFMEDSDRAAAVALERRVDVGLHLNFTTPFSGTAVPARLAEHQLRLGGYLRRHRLAQVVFHPGLVRSFEYVVAAQLDEFRRLYGTAPDRIDGHHHMHLCANVMFQHLLPEGTLARRNFYFGRGEKWAGNRAYRALLDAILARRHRVVDFLFALPHDRPERFQQICGIARQSVVEVETHPVNPAEYTFLAGGGVFTLLGDVSIAPEFAPKRSANSRGAAGSSRLPRG